jgi:hypothetical protein
MAWQADFSFISRYLSALPASLHFAISVGQGSARKELSAMSEGNGETFSAGKEKLLKRLRPYWKMELANVFVVPGIAMFVLRYLGGKVTWAVGASMLATSFLLIVGTIAIKMLVDSLEKNRTTEQAWVPRLAMARWPSILLIALAIGFTVVEAVSTLPRFSASLGCAALLTLLAILEYINYYHVQLQHFDNAADFRRLITGKGFRKSHLARAIASWETKKRTGP